MSYIDTLNNRYQTGLGKKSNRVRKTTHDLENITFEKATVIRINRRIDKRKVYCTRGNIPFYVRVEKNYLDEYRIVQVDAQGDTEISGITDILKRIVF